MTVVVRINDRGPFKPGRVIDLSRAAAERVGMIGSGVVEVRLDLFNAEQADPEPVNPELASANQAIPAPVLAAAQAAPPSGTDGASQRLTLDASLSGFSVKTAQYPAGQLLLLSSHLYPHPLYVRVVGAAPGTQLLASSEALGLLGETVTVGAP